MRGKGPTAQIGSNPRVSVLSINKRSYPQEDSGRDAGYEPAGCTSKKAKAKEIHREAPKRIKAMKGSPYEPGFFNLKWQ